MEHQLPDTLTLDSEIGVEFSHEDSTGTSVGMDIEFEHIEEQPMLMETGSQEIEYMGDEFTLGSDTQYIQEVQELQSSEVIQTEIIQAPEPVIQRAINIPKQIAIAPKPTVIKPAYTTGKQYAIAPKPMAVTAGKTGAVKKVSISGVSGVMQMQKSGQSVLAQIGKQFVMMPSGGTQKIKLVQSDGTPIQAQIITSKNVTAAPATKKPILAKLVTQGQPTTDQPAVISKITSSGACVGPRFVSMQPRATPIPNTNKILLSPPNLPTTRLVKPKHQLVAVKSSPSKIYSSQATQKFVLANPQKNIVLKTTIPQKQTQILKADGNIVNVSSAQRTQTVNGVQYIRLVSNNSSSNPPKLTPVTVVKQQGNIAGSQKLVFTDAKGNILQMSDKVIRSAQPPPLVMTSAANKGANKSAPKLVRIAPIATKTTQAATMQETRPGQSLLTPINKSYTTSQTMESSKEIQHIEKINIVEESVLPQAQFEISFKQEMSTSEDTFGDSSVVEEEISCVEEHPLIVIPSNYENQEQYEDTEQTENSSLLDERYSASNYENTSGEGITSPPPISETDLENRPRKPCNCTKSQCLKLYCDCFANGEFCNKCNCFNCKNNLDNEELRQRAIRGCLDRNPNAFRPKIGKSKTNGPEQIRRHNKGCNCKRSGCLKNYCECYEAKIACTSICKCVGCRNVEEALERLLRHRNGEREATAPPFRSSQPTNNKQPCSFITNEVVEAVCQCLIAAAAGNNDAVPNIENDPISNVIDEFSRCLQDIINASHQTPNLDVKREDSM